VEKLDPLRSPGELAPLHGELPLSGFQITATLRGLYPDRMIRFRYSRLKAGDYLRAWIHHLFLNCLKADGYPVTTLLAGLDPGVKDRAAWSAWRFEPLDDSGQVLGDLLERYWGGLKIPLPLFPESSWDYAFATLKRSKPPEEALLISRKTYEGTEYTRGEGEDPYYQLCFRSQDPISGAFAKTAEDLFTPMFEHMREE
jgi:exodeoxyribonuclease V gamma subunit